MKTLLDKVELVIADESLGDVMGRIAMAMPFDCEIVNFGDNLRIQATQAPTWAVEATLVIRSEPAVDDYRQIMVEVNCPSTRRSPAQAVAFARLFTTFAEAACLAEAIHGGKAYPHP